MTEETEEEKSGLTFVPSRIRSEIPAVVKKSAQDWDEVDAENFVKEYEKNKKSVPISYLLLALFGWHYVYLEGWGKALLFWLTGGGLMVWWLVDFFRIPKLVRQANEEAAQEVAKDISMLS